MIALAAVSVNVYVQILPFTLEKRKNEMGSEVLTGTHFWQGDVACAEGALAAGCRFFAGYPITPATEIAERMAQRLPEVGGVYIQMEDELASLAAVIGP
jgi:2-oxoglutarate ferredoxin oxidoreductase subunit alpha